MLDIAVIGAGMAGLTAGIYGARSGLTTAVFEQFMPGGQTASIVKLDNYPGFPQGIDGATLMLNVLQQAEGCGCELHYAGVERISAGKAGQPHLLHTAEGSVEALAIIVAGGALPRKLGLEGEERLIGHGVSFCATCDAPLCRGKRVAVAGWGIDALRDTLELAEQADKVWLLSEKDALSGSSSLQAQVCERQNIEVIYNTKVTALRGQRQLEAVELTDTRAASLKRDLALDALFVALGKAPVSEFLGGVLELDSRGHIVTRPDLSTSVEGIFAAGDVRDTLLRQVITAAADGALAATSAARYVRSLNAARRRS